MDGMLPELGLLGLLSFFYFYDFSCFSPSSLASVNFHPPESSPPFPSYIIHRPSTTFHLTRVQTLQTLLPVRHRPPIAIMTRSHKFTDRDHAGLADGTAHEDEHLPRYFAKAGHTDSDPNKTKKNGGGKGNWGHPGDELADLNGYTLANTRRRSNSSTHVARDFKTKFETVEPEPVFEEELHGPNALGADLEKSSTTSSSKSVEDEEEGGAGGAGEKRG